MATDLTPEEREALRQVIAAWEQEPAFEGSAEPEVAVDFVQRCLAAVPRLAAPSGRQVGERDALCADCGHPEDWHTGSFTACNHPHHQCRCDGFLPAPLAAREDSDGK